jgi:DNA-binding NtrC family response regulator
MDAPTQVTRVVQRDGQSVRVVRGCRVEVLAGPDAGLALEVTQARFGVGSHASNEVALSDTTVSRHHLEVEATPFGFRVADLGSSNGSFAGALRLGEVVAATPLTLQLGQTTLRLGAGDVESEVPASSESSFGELVGRSLVMRELFAQLAALAQSDCPLLVEGETGVGKERVAESLHAASPRAGAPFVIVDCGAMSPGLMESELFGHVRGAFTGAHEDRRGLIEMAEGGTLFLDEIGELPPLLQAKLVGVLERRRVTPVGASESRPLNLRCLAATHRDLLRLCNEGRFRVDLYYRVAMVRLRIPPLRERMDDLPLLVAKRLADLRAREGERVPDQLSAVALAHLYAQSWPGNVRELFNAVEQAALQSLQSDGTPPPAFEPLASARERFLQEFEARYLTEALARCYGNISETARRTGIERRNLQRMLRRAGI